MATLVDSHQRRFRYLRLSITDSCNFRCGYCLPNGNCVDPQAEKPLTLTEIDALVRGFAQLGVEKVRITGGEPTLRRDVVEIFSLLSEIPGIRDLALSTNGYRLSSLVDKLKVAGCSAVNVSLDSLVPEKFREITASGLHSAVLEGIEAALSTGLRVKVNAVLMRGINDEDLPQFLDFVATRDLSVRFIELMRTGDNEELFRARHVRAEGLIRELERQGWSALPRGALSGPAVEFGHTDYLGRIGFITPYAQNFCAGCNRLRVSCRGELKLCLFGDGQTSLRHLLFSGSALSEFVLEQLGTKKVSHSLQSGVFGNTRNLASIGG